MYWNHKGIETMNPASATMFAIHRMAFTFCLLTSNSSRAPASGRNRMIERRWLMSNPRRTQRVLSFVSFVSFASSHKQIHAHEGENTEQHQQRVILDQPGLHAAKRMARLLRDPADEIHEAVDDGPIGQPREPRADDGDFSGSVDGAVDHVAIDRP